MSTAEFRFSEARSLIKDLGAPKPLVYWVDFGLSITMAHAASFTVLCLGRGLGIDAVLFVAAAFLYMRSAMFIHEIAHLNNKLPAFDLIWNLTCGCLLLVPSFMYIPHVDHHRRQSYGTETDGEYLPLSHRSRWLILGFILQNLFIPFLLYIRFLIISPICWIIPPVRSWAHRHASTMLVDPSYERDAATPQVLRTVVWQEACCFVWLAWFSFGGLLTNGSLVRPLWFYGYAMAVTILTINGLRTLGSHRWTGDGSQLSFEQQLLDSANYPSSPWITELWGPIGTRFHALHHLFPSLPYHDLPEAHRRLMVGLPDDSPYRQTVCRSLTGELVALWNRAGRRKSRADDPPSFC